MRSMNIAALGMSAQQTNVDNIANNIANVNTTGFKRNRVEFADLLYQNQRTVGATSSDAGTVVPSGVYLGSGVRVTGTYRINEQGNMKQTDNNYDMAINGEGFFQIELPSGETAYTRDGTFQLSPEGRLVTADGYTILPGIDVPPEAVEVTISKTGLVQVRLDGEQDPQDVGQLEIAKFANVAGLRAAGDNILMQTAASGDAVTGNPGDPSFGTIRQGFLENSNVDIVTEITDLISAQRAYELNSKVITTSDTMLGDLTQLR